MAAEGEQVRSVGAFDSEIELVRALREGDERSHAQLWHRFGARLHGFASSRLGGDRGLADDIVVQTLAAAVQGIARFNPHRSTLSAWVYGIARRQIQGELRRQRRRKSVPASAQVPLEDVPEAASEGDTAADVAARLDAQREVAELARSLSDVEMEALSLHYVHELSEKEIAQIVGRSGRAVHSILHRAKEKARERLVRDAD